MTKELDIAGVFVTPLLGWTVIALIAWVFLGRLIDLLGLSRWIWHRGLFNAALFILVLGGVAFLAVAV